MLASERLAHELFTVQEHKDGTVRAFPEIPLERPILPQRLDSVCVKLYALHAAFPHSASHLKASAKRCARFFNVFVGEMAFASEASLQSPAQLLTNAGNADCCKKHTVQSFT